MNRSVVIAVATAASVSAGVLTWIEVRQEREFRRLVAAGDAALAQDQTSVAIEKFSGAIAFKRDSMLAYLKRGDTYRRRREFNAALRDLRQAASLDPTATRPLELLGDVHAGLGRYRSATEDYHQYIVLDDREPRVLYKLAVAYFRDEQIQPATDALRKAIAIDDQIAEAHYLLGLCLRQLKRRDEARRVLTRAVALNPGFVPAREELADLDASVGRRHSEIEQLEALAALEPARADRLIQVGLTLARFGRQDAAIATLTRAAELHPNAPAVFAAIGRVWLQAAEDDADPVALAKALAALQSATARGDRSGETLSMYGRALLRTGRITTAERILQEATSRLPVDPVAFRDLSIAASRLGHADIARRALANHAELVQTDSDRHD